MDAHDVGARRAIGFQPVVDGGDHQVHVERQGRVRAQGLHHVRADGQVGHEMAVHDIDVDPVGARRFKRADLLAQAGEVAGQDGGADQRGGRGRLGHGLATYVGARRGASRAAEASPRVPHCFERAAAFRGDWAERDPRSDQDAGDLHPEGRAAGDGQLRPAALLPDLHRPRHPQARRAAGQRRGRDDGADRGGDRPLRRCPGNQGAGAGRHLAHDLSQARPQGDGEPQPSGRDPRHRPGGRLPGPDPREPVQPAAPAGLSCSRVGRAGREQGRSRGAPDRASAAAGRGGVERAQRLNVLQGDLPDGRHLGPDQSGAKRDYQNLLSGRGWLHAADTDCLDLRHEFQLHAGTELAVRLSGGGGGDDPVGGSALFRLPQETLALTVLRRAADRAETGGGETHHVVAGAVQVARPAQAAGQAIQPPRLAQRQGQGARQVVPGPI
uniref:Beta-galactosidase n=1 Tax=Parastrongyloides trichosuri TaxID=131310 RepID=A0A0N5A6Y4_PARTI